jgi:predicted ABC-type ATPase
MKDGSRNTSRNPHFKKILSLAEEVLVTGKNIRSKKANNITYLSAAIAEFIRQEMLLSESSFSFESVFSHPSKVDFIRQAKKAGYKTYFYFIATQDYQINQERVLNRVQLGEHDVPPDKIRDRYYKTMHNLYEALRLADRAFLLIIQNIQRLTHTRCSSKKAQINYILKPTKFQNGFGCSC